MIDEDMSREAFWFVIDNFDHKNKFDTVLSLLRRVYKEEWTPIMMALHLCNDFSDQEKHGFTFKLNLKRIGGEFSPGMLGIEFSLKNWGELGLGYLPAYKNYEIGAENYLPINITFYYKNTETMSISLCMTNNNKQFKNTEREMSFDDIRKDVKKGSTLNLNNHIFDGMSELLDIEKENFEF